MKVACIDKSAADRLKLQKLLEDAYDSCRANIGHLLPAVLYPLSKEEALFANTPEAVVLGPTFSVEESIACLRELREVHPQVPLLVFLSNENYSFRNLRRFEQFTPYLFSITEPITRFLHCLFMLDRERTKTARGFLLVASGVKGGVGTTTLVAGMAHAAEAVGKSSIVVDLSAASSLAHYLATPRWHSTEYTTLLTDGAAPDLNTVRKLITVAPNGIHLLLPPAGGSEIRDLWLRESKRFELSLEIIEILRELYDLIIVDTAGAEGLLPFALQARADSRTLITSNEPASVHLLSQRLMESNEIPGAGTTQVLINRLFERGLTSADVEDFVESHSHGVSIAGRVHTVSFDAGGRGWIGTGNSIYTESGRQLQNQLERILVPHINPQFKIALEDSNSKVKGILPGATAAATSAVAAAFSFLARSVQRPKFPALPLLATKSATNIYQMESTTPKAEPTAASGVMTSDSISHLYEPPKLVGNS